MYDLLLYLVMRMELRLKGDGKRETVWLLGLSGLAMRRGCLGFAQDICVYTTFNVFLCAISALVEV